MKDDPFWNFPGAGSQTVQSSITTTGNTGTIDSSDPFAFFSTVEVGKKKVKKVESNTT